MLKFRKYIGRFFLLIIGASFLFPLYWMLNLSFKSKIEVYQNPFGLPHDWVFTNYGEVLDRYPFFSYMFNSAIYTAGTVLLTLLLGSLLAYAISRMKWKGSKFALNFITLGLILPSQVAIIPLYMMIKSMGLRGTYFSLIFPYSAFALASCVLMLNAFFRSLPRELEEAACIDGCNVYQCYYRIILPSVMPALTTQFVLISLSTWNEFFLALIFASKASIRPLTIGLLDFFTSIGVSHWGLIGAAMIMSSMPTILIYCFGNSQIENALTAGAVLK